MPRKKKKKNNNITKSNRSRNLYVEEGEYYAEIIRARGCGNFTVELLDGNHVIASTTGSIRKKYKGKSKLSPTQWVKVEQSGVKGTPYKITMKYENYEVGRLRDENLLTKRIIITDSKNDNKDDMVGFEDDDKPTKEEVDADTLLDELAMDI